jgi:hypothetical protein
MSKRKRTSGDLDDTELFYDEQLDVDGFLDNMGKPAREKPLETRSAWRLLEERNDVRKLREQLEDWDDWERVDTH